MTFLPIALYSTDGEFVGWAIKDDGVAKLQSTNIWGEDEMDSLGNRLRELNEHHSIARFWPNPQDPDVVALINDVTFEPINYIEQEIVDEDRSNYVWQKVAAQGPEGEAIWIDGPELDETASTIVYKTALVPERPTDQVQRIKKACEVVARQRAGLL